MMGPRIYRRRTAAVTRMTLVRQNLVGTNTTNTFSCAVLISSAMVLIATNSGAISMITTIQPALLTNVTTKKVLKTQRTAGCISWTPKTIYRTQTMDQATTDCVTGSTSRCN